MEKIRNNEEKKKKEAQANISRLRSIPHPQFSVRVMHECKLESL